MYSSVIIPAGGSSQRYQKHKLLEFIHGKLVIEHSIQAFLSSPLIHDIIVPCHADILSHIPSALKAHPQLHWVEGGRTRSESVYLGVRALRESCDTVLVHDAARPNVSKVLIEALFRALQEASAVVPGIPVSDTIKIIDGGMVQQTLDRNRLIAVQTPQGFHKQLLEAAYSAVPDYFAFTDESSLVEASGVPVQVIEGDIHNIKLTYRQDFHRLCDLMSPAG